MRWVIITVVVALILVIISLSELHIKHWINELRFKHIYLKAQHAKYKRKFR